MTGDPPTGNQKWAEQPYPSRDCPDIADELDRLTSENERLRAALAFSDQPCAYCSLPADEWAKCQHGWPGCSRSDDAAGCPELGAMMELEAVRDERDRQRAVIAELVGSVRRLSDVSDQIWMKVSDQELDLLSGAWARVERALAAASAADGGEDDA